MGWRGPSLQILPGAAIYPLFLWLLEEKTPNDPDYKTSIEKEKNPVSGPNNWSLWCHIIECLWSKHNGNGLACLCLSLVVVVFEGSIYVDAAQWVRAQIPTYLFPKLVEAVPGGRGYTFHLLPGSRFPQGGAGLVNDTHHWEPHAHPVSLMSGLGTHEHFAKPSEADGRLEK